MKTLVIVRIDKIIPIPFLINHAPGIWACKVTMTAAEKAASPIVAVLGQSFGTYNEIPLNLESVLVGADQYSKVNSLSDLYLSPRAFYFDYASQIIYINYQNPYWIFKATTAGDAISYIDKLQYNGNFPTSLTERYEPRLKADSIDVSQSIDPLEYGIFKYGTISFVLDNTDGALDTINEESAGRGCRVIYASCDDCDEITQEDLIVCRNSYVQNIEFNGTEVSITAKDARKKWSDKINTEFFTVAEYSQLKDGDVDKRKPLCLGTCYNVPCTQIATTTPTFMFTTDTYGAAGGVTQVYVDGVATANGGTETDGTFTIAGYTNGKVTADVVGVDKGNDVEKILWLLSEFAGLAYVTSNFNLSEINYAITLSKEGSLYIGTSGRTLSECIEQLLTNNGAWLIQQGEVFTVRIYDVDKVETREVFYDELSEFPVRAYDEQQFISSITTSYHKDENEKTFYTVYDNQFEDLAIADQSRLESKDLETTLLTEADSQAIGERYYSRFFEVPATIEMKLLSDISGYYPSDVWVYEHIRKIYVNEKLTDKIILARSNYLITDIDWINKTATLQYMKANPLPVYTVKYMYNDRMYNDTMYA